MILGGRSFANPLAQPIKKSPFVSTRAPLLHRERCADGPAGRCQSSALTGVVPKHCGRLAARVTHGQCALMNAAICCIVASPGSPIFVMMLPCVRSAISTVSTAASAMTRTWPSPMAQRAAKPSA